MQTQLPLNPLTYQDEIDDCGDNASGFREYFWIIPDHVAAPDEHGHRY
jgi:hypothetical protein